MDTQKQISVVAVRFRMTSFGDEIVAARRTLYVRVKGREGRVFHGE